MGAGELMRVPVKFPPGIVRNGTEYDSQGFWYDMNLMRFGKGGNPQNINGWRKKKAAAGTVTGKARCIVTWTDNSNQRWGVIGTHSKLYAMSSAGDLTDITPSGFTAGDADATLAGGYGGGGYGVGSFGTPRPDSSSIQPASVWTMATFGQNWLGMMAEDGNLYEWPRTGIAAVISAAPTGRACFVPKEGMAGVLAADGNNRRVAWSDRRDNTEWTPDATNEAGDFDLETKGRLMMARPVNGGTLIWTDFDVHIMTFKGGTLVFGFDVAGEQCGAISQNCAAVVNGVAYWMSPSGFWSHNGYVSPLDCPVLDYVFGDINTLQASKIVCEVNSAYSEVTWRYCSSASNEIDRSVTVNYKDGTWLIGQDARLCGVDASPFFYPLRVADDGYVYEHEVGFQYGGATPFIEHAPVELGNGDYVAYVTKLIPDERVSGQVQVIFKTRMEPNGAETVSAAYTITGSDVDVRLCGRQLKTRFEGVATEPWKIGKFRLEVTQGGLK